MNEDDFITRWRERYPGVSPPQTHFNKIEDAEVVLEGQRSLNHKLKMQLQENMLYMDYLEAVVSSKKKSLASTSGVTTSNNNNNKPSSLNDVTKPDDNMSASAKRKSKVLESVKLFESQQGDTSQSSGTAPSSSSHPLQRVSTRRRTPYLEMWECKSGQDQQKADNQGAPSQPGGSGPQRHGSVSADHDKFGPMVKHDSDVTKGPPKPAVRIHTPSAGATSHHPNMTSHHPNMTSQQGRPPRSDYVEVWQCQTGNQVELGVVYDDQADFQQHLQQQNDNITATTYYPSNTNPPNQEEDYDVTDIDMKDGYGKRHYTIASGDVKLLTNDVIQGAGTSMTWPSKNPQPYEEEDDMLIEDGRFSQSNLLSDDDEDFTDEDDSDDVESDDDDDDDDDINTSDQVGCNQSSSPTTTSQLQQHNNNIVTSSTRNMTTSQKNSSSNYELIRQARTTDERLGQAAKISASFWISSSADDTAASHHISPHGGASGKDGRQSIISLQSSIDIQSSDDDILSDDRTSLRSSEVSENSPALIPRRSQTDTTSPVKKPASTTSNDKNQMKTTTTKPALATPTTTTNVIPASNDQQPSSPNRSSSFHRQSALTASFKNDSEMVDYQKVRNVQEAEKFRKRHWVLQCILENEEKYLQYLNTLLLYMKPLRASISSSQPVMSLQDHDTVFYRVQDLHTLHSSFYSELVPRVQHFTSDTQVADIFDNLLSKLNLYRDYLQNYKKSKQTVEKCSKENPLFAELITKMKVQSKVQQQQKSPSHHHSNSNQTSNDSNSESVNLDEMLYKPVERVMKATLSLQDLLKHTPNRHPDYQVLRKVLKYSQTFLDKINTMSSYKPRRIPTEVAAAARNRDREQIKQGFLVEVSSDGQRKLRYVVLYTDLLLCTKEKLVTGMFHNSKISYDCKWYIQLADLSFEPFKDSDPLPEFSKVSEDDLRQYMANQQQYKNDINKERKRHRKKHGNNNGTAQEQPLSRREDRLIKKMELCSSKIILETPSLPLKLYHQCGKSYLFLMSSDYERIEWKESIMKMQENCFKSFPLTSLEINTLLNNNVRPKKLAMAGSRLMMAKEDELLSGYLTVTIHSAKGFLTKCNPYCCLEVDSFGQFQTKAKTRHCENTLQPEWEEEFELEVDGAQQLRILIFEKTGNFSDETVLIAKTKVGLNKDILGKSGQWNRTKFLFNEIEIECSFIFVPREHSLQRLPSKVASGVFGVKIDLVGKRDITGIPSIVRKLVEEVERRGMDEIGIYRVSGVLSDIRTLKHAFNTKSKEVNKIMAEVDINAVAGVLKLYFRELPEPLFTNSRYRDFVDATGLMEPDTKLSTFKKLLADLPATNYKTLYYLRQHLIKVAKNDSVNKMNLQNIATVFGPTLLRPADSSQNVTNINQLSNLRLDVHFQMDALLFCLENIDMIPYERLRASKTSEIMLSQQKRDFRPYEEIQFGTADDVTIVTSSNRS